MGSAHRQIVVVDHGSVIGTSVIAVLERIHPPEHVLVVCLDEPEARQFAAHNLVPLFDGVPVPVMDKKRKDWEQPRRSLRYKRKGRR